MIINFWIYIYCITIHILVTSWLVTLKHRNYIVAKASIQRLTEDVFEMVKINRTEIVTAHSDVGEQFVKAMVFCPSPPKKSKVEAPLMGNGDYDADTETYRIMLLNIKVYLTQVLNNIQNFHHPVMETRYLILP